ncbi:MAG: membrane dipeptidase [Nitrospirales bacterium]|nr:membrane dipeptidase [Nitrospirales bacterium]
MVTGTLQQKNLVWLILILMTVAQTNCSLISSSSDALINQVSLDPPYNLENPTAHQFHQSLFVADLHADTLLWDRNLLERHERGHLDVPRMIEGNIALQAFTVFTKIPLPYQRWMSTPWRETYYSQHGPDVGTLLAMAQLGDERKRGSLKERALFYGEQFQEWADKSDGKLTFITSSEDLHNYLIRRKSTPFITAGVLGLEGAHALEGDVKNLQEFYDTGFRMIALVHFFDNEFGGSSTGDEKGGLKPQGEELVKKLGEQKLILDLAHASHKTIDDVMDLYDIKPPYPLPGIVVSHIGIQETCERGERNLRARHIKRIAQHGGLIGIGLWKGAMCGTDVGKTVDAIEAVKKLLGNVDSISVGSDFDGAVRTHFDATGMPLLTQALQSRGFNDQEVRQIMGENLRDFLLAHLP